MRSLLLLAALLFALPAHAEVTIEWVTVGDPGNACDTQPQGCFGAVAFAYKISKYETTNAQYAAFLNAVAADDTYLLWNPGMGSGWGGITRSGSPGSYTYSAIAGRENMPVIYVSWYDALRFANWLHNGQPTGAQDDSTTEDGAYYMSTGSSVVRKAGAKVFLSREDEWYKAAYYDTALNLYYDYPAGSDTETTCASPGATPNTANCSWAAYDYTDVGSYTGSASPNGTFDQGGNVREWTETGYIYFGNLYRVLRGGWRDSDPDELAASFRLCCGGPATDSSDVGFRVASPASAYVPSLSPVGMALLGGVVFGIAIVGLGIAARRRLK